MAALEGVQRRSPLMHLGGSRDFDGGGRVGGAVLVHQPHEVLSHPERPFCGHAGGLCWGRRHDGAPRANVVRTRSGSGRCADGGYRSTLSHQPGLDQPFPCPPVVHFVLSRASRPATRVVALQLLQSAGHMGEPAAEVAAVSTERQAELGLPPAIATWRHGGASRPGPGAVASASVCRTSRRRRPVVDAVSCTAELVASLGHRVEEATLAVFGRPSTADSTSTECSLCTDMRTSAGADGRQTRRYGRCRTGRMTNSLTSTSAGWLIA